MKDSERPKRIYRKRPTEYQPKVTTNKITYEQQLKIVNWIAVYMENPWIKEQFLKDEGIELTENGINHYRYYPGWKPTIDRKREEFNSFISDEEFSSKRRRIQELTKAWRRLEPDDTTLMDAVKIMGQIREEMEGKAATGITLNQYNQYNAVSDDELRKIIVENSRFLEIAEKKKKAIEVEAVDGA